MALIVLLLGAGKFPGMAHSLGESARTLKSEARAMKKEGEAAATPQAPADADRQTAPHTIAAAPGDVSGARPLTEPHHSRPELTPHRRRRRKNGPAPAGCRTSSPVRLSARRPAPRRNDPDARAR
ncbi:hypothetical protein ABZZ79_36615 [Streptomyces sp. NPDC006458]|uniref:hypothetical protein n=1 Tax=Streptomyces sp. NPDC006458 TaxID=3154302 RepID=UPI0033A9CCAC